MGRIIPLIITTITLLVFDLYIYKAITSIYPQWPQKKKRIFNVLWWGYTILLIIGAFVSIYVNIRLGTRTILLVAFFITFVSKFFFIPILLVDDIRRLIVWVKRKINVKNTQAIAAENPISRSDFLVKSGMAVAAIPFATLSYGIVSGAYDYRVKHHTLYLPNLPKAFDGIKLGQISDIHSGSFYNKKAVTGGINLLLKEKPDFIFFTGDLVNNRAEEMRDYQDIFSKVKAPLGVFSTLGNHDYGMYEKWESEKARLKNLANVIKTHELMGWHLLMNQNRSLKVDGQEIGVLGIENWGAGRFPKYGKMTEAIKNTDHYPVKLLLSHDPSHWQAQILPHYPQIDAVFAGHTHGAQFGVELPNFKWSPVQYIYNEWDGLYQQGKQQLYVNVGFGFIGYPGRVGILPEITVFTLKASEKPA
ncbi:MAG: metallophosphoesterase [Sphingobacteriales bacterium]|nr:MAG: metallophosphoesterase [Sphingobacteriales bacterium]